MHSACPKSANVQHRLFAQQGGLPSLYIYCPSDHKEGSLAVSYLRGEVSVGRGLNKFAEHRGRAANRVVTRGIMALELAASSVACQLSICATMKIIARHERLPVSREYELSRHTSRRRGGNEARYSLFERKAIKFAVRRGWGPVREPGPLTLTVTAPPSKAARSNAYINLTDWNSAHFDMDQCAHGR